jgi:predicted phage tail protein
MSNDWLKNQFQRADSPNDDSTNIGSEIPQSETPSNSEVEVLTEEKFDKDIIPTTKNVGMIGSVIIGGLMAFYGSWVAGLLYAVGGVMVTLGLCVLLEGISTIIKLLRKISEK